QVSGKKASVVSTDVAQEAYELAKIRSKEAELKLMVQMAKEMANDEATIKGLQSQLTTAQQMAKAETEAVKGGGEVKAPSPRVLANNTTGQFADIYVNGMYKTDIPPYESRWIVIEQKVNPVVLTAYGNEDISSWGPRYIWGKFATYTWNLG